MPRGSLRVVLFSDVHLDQAYSASAPPDCNHCRPCSTGGPNATASRPLGRPGCDAPRSLVRAAFAAAAATLPAPDMLLVLGDLAAHNQPSLAATHSAFSEVTDMLSNAFPSASAPGVACGVTIGNNDVFPDYAVNLTADGYYAPQAASVAHLCGLSAAQQSALARRGYYRVDASPGLRVLLLNTDVYAARGGAAPVASNATDDDPLGQFAWLDHELSLAAAANASAALVGHIPPALDSYDHGPQWVAAYAERYWALAARHATTVAAHLFGHLHTNQFRVWPSAASASADASSASAADAALAAAPPLLSLSSISPIFHNQPTYHLLTFTPDDPQPTSADPAHAATRPGLVLSEVQTFYLPLDQMVADDAAAAPTPVPSASFAPLCNATALLAAAAPPALPSAATAPSPPPPRLSNANYAALAASFARRTAVANASWEAFHATINAHGRLAVSSCASAALMGRCDVCEGGCRDAWVCLLASGLSSASYTQCLAAEVRAADSTLDSTADADSLPPSPPPSHHGWMPVAGRAALVALAACVSSAAILALTFYAMVRATRDEYAEGSGGARVLGAAGAMPGELTRESGSVSSVELPLGETHPPVVLEDSLSRGRGHTR